MFPLQGVRTRFPTQAVRGQPSYPGAMVGRPPRGPRIRPVGHNQQQSRVDGAGMSGMAGQRVNFANTTATPGGIPVSSHFILKLIVCNRRRILVDFPSTWQTKSIYSLFVILLSHRS